MIYACVCVCVCVCARAQARACALSCFSHVQLSATHQAPLSVGFSRQEYWSELLFPLPGDLSDPGIEPKFLTFPALAGGFFTASTTWKALDSYISADTSSYIL